MILTVDPMIIPTAAEIVSSLYLLKKLSMTLDKSKIPVIVPNIIMNIAKKLVSAKNFDILPYSPNISSRKLTDNPGKIIAPAEIKEIRNNFIM